MHRSFQKNKFHGHTIRILENRRVGTGGGNIWFPPPWSSATILNQEGKVSATEGIVVFPYEVQARAPRGGPPRKQDFLRLFLIEKNLLAVSTGKLWMNMFLTRTHTCIARKISCLERII